jgi:hypothetical protein
MRKILVIGVFAALVMLLTAAFGLDGGDGEVAQPRDSHEVSPAQYRILISQCRYADTVDAQTQCRSQVAANYRIGEANPTLDCRTYSSVTVCGELSLSEKERACLQDAVRGGMTHRRAEVECYAFR